MKRGVASLLILMTFSYICKGQSYDRQNAADVLAPSQPGLAETYLTESTENKLATVADFEVQIIDHCGYVSTKFINKSANADTFLWDYNGSGRYIQIFEPRGSNIYQDSHWTVTLIAKANGLSDTLTKQVSITFSKIKAELENVDSAFYAPVQVQYYNKSVPKEGDTLTYNWHFEDGTSSILENPVHIYAEPGTYIAQLTGINQFGCELNGYSSLTVKDSAQKGEFDFPVSSCFSMSEFPSDGNVKYFEFRNDSLIIKGYYTGNCGSSKTVTIKRQNDTINIKIWETGAFATCVCHYGFELPVPDVPQDSVVVNFNGEFFKVLKTSIQQPEYLENSPFIYPNPANDMLYIDLPGFISDKLLYEIYNLKGVNMQSGNISAQAQIKLERNKLTKGLYYVILKTDSKILLSEGILIE